MMIGLSLVCLLATQVLAQDSGAASLSSKHRRWLEEEVVYIITDREREIFLILNTIEERERFIESFWRRRDPESATPENEFKDEHYRRLKHANTTCDFKFEAHHSLVPMETFLRCAVTEPLAGPCVELLCDTIAVALRERCLAGALRQVLS